MDTQTKTKMNLKRDEDGHLADYTDWNEDVARQLAEEEDIELTDRHWIVINFMRNDYEEKGEAPSIRRIKTYSDVSTKELYQLFPKGPAKKAAKIAGLPKPKGCI